MKINCYAHFNGEENLSALAVSFVYFFNLGPGDRNEREIENSEAHFCLRFLSFLSLPLFPSFRFIFLFFPFFLGFNRKLHDGKHHGRTKKLISRLRGGNEKRKKKEKKNRTSVSVRS